jgi:hypothetical protein
MNSFDDEFVAKLAYQVVILRQALSYFVADERFDIGVGGNPNVVPQMIARAKRIYEETALRPQERIQRERSERK